MGWGIGIGQVQNLLYIYHLCIFYFCVSVLLHVKNVYNFVCFGFLNLCNNWQEI